MRYCHIQLLSFFLLFFAHFDCFAQEDIGRDTKIFNCGLIQEVLHDKKYHLIAGEDKNSNQFYDPNRKYPLNEILEVCDNGVISGYDCKLNIESFCINGTEYSLNLSNNSLSGFTNVNSLGISNNHFKNPEIKNSTGICPSSDIPTSSNNDQSPKQISDENINDLPVGVYESIPNVLNITNISDLAEFTLHTKITVTKDSSGKKHPHVSMELRDTANLENALHNPNKPKGDNSYKSEAEAEAEGSDDLLFPLRYAKYNIFSPSKQFATCTKYRNIEEKPESTLAYDTKDKCSILKSHLELMNNNPNLSPTLTSQAVANLGLHDKDCKDFDIESIDRILTQSTPDKTQDNDHIEVNSEKSLMNESKKYRKRAH
jgi:hypothetical protein